MNPRLFFNACVLALMALINALFLLFANFYNFDAFRRTVTIISRQWYVSERTPWIRVTKLHLIAWLITANKDHPSNVNLTIHKLALVHILPAFFSEHFHRYIRTPLQRLSFCRVRTSRTFVNKKAGIFCSYI